jgi:phosphopantetheinyl transferase
MNTLYLNSYSYPAPGIYLCIGVKNTGVDIDILAKLRSGFKIVKRFREVKSCRYLNDEGHILQPAMVEITKE